jgi:hypothetical protein
MARTWRAGAARNVQSLVDELCATSPEFATMWRDNDVQGHGDGRTNLQRRMAEPERPSLPKFVLLVQATDSNLGFAVPNLG